MSGIQNQYTVKIRFLKLIYLFYTRKNLQPVVGCINRFLEILHRLHHGLNYVFATAGHLCNILVEHITGG